MYLFENCRSSKQDDTPMKSIHRLVGGHLHHSVYRKVDDPYPQMLNRSSKLFQQEKPSSTASFHRSVSTKSKIDSSKSNFDIYPSPTSATFDALSNSDSAQEPVSTKESVFIVEAESLGYNNPETESAVKSMKKNEYVKFDENKDEKRNDESKKTLSDQVADGKYGLIQDELFKTTPKRPGILSYTSNPEIPSDTSDNLGGLNHRDIWLAEDHLLVLKGGNLNNREKNEPWKPIDNYKAPLRQVKIPDNPRVPPPFLVQLEENGPIEFIGNNQLPPLVNPFTNESLLFPKQGFPKTETYSHNKTYLYARPGAVENSSPPNNSFKHNYSLNGNFTNFGRMPNNFTNPPVIGINGSLDNHTSVILDDDDPSFYYPPPYSFVYNSNYSSFVEPGPLVPGLVIPPPPNFFGKLEKNIEKIKFTLNPSTQRTEKPVVHPVNKTRVNGIKVYKQITRTKPLLLNNIHQKGINSTITTHSTKINLNSFKEQKLLPFNLEEAIVSEPIIKDKGRPIYYEYYDSKISTPTYTSTTTTTPTFRAAIHSATKQTIRRPYNAYLPIKPSTEKYVIITPRPQSDIVQIGDTQNYKTSLKTAPLRTYNTEIENIRHTIEFFKNQETQKKQNNTFSRFPKTKAVFEYSFDASPNEKNSKLFHPGEIDLVPFKPMVKYSSPLETESGFKAIAYTTVPTSTTRIITTPSTTKNSAFNLQYLPTIEEIFPKKTTLQYIPIDTSVLKSIPMKPTEHTGVTQMQIPIRYSTVSPWVTVEKQVLRQVPHKEINVQIQTHTPTARPISFLRGVTKPHDIYYIDGNDSRKAFKGMLMPIRKKLPAVTSQQNAYLRQIESIRQQLNKNADIDITVENGSKNIQKYRTSNTLPENFIATHQLDSQSFPHLSQILSPSYNLNQHKLPQVVHSLHRDILVNYKYPLPTTESESEFLPPPHLLHPLPPAPLVPFNRYGRLIGKPPTVIQYKLPGDMNAGVIFYTPFDERYSHVNMGNL